MTLLLLIPLFFPIITTLIIRLLKISFKVKSILNLIVITLNAILVYLLIFLLPDKTLNILRLNDYINIYFKLDGLGEVFAMMISFLWPLAYLYALEYMKDEKSKENYLTIYVVLFGLALALTFAGNLLTLLVFYETLTLLTIPLIIHLMDKSSILAAKYYFYMSLCGFALIIIGLIILVSNFKINDFNEISKASELALLFNNSKTLAYVAFIFLFLGFGVNSALIPLHLWLIKAIVAPAPTTALLHDVTIVNSASFGIIRVIYFVFGYEFLNNSIVIILASILAIITILFGSIMALKQLHLKRRFAFSTISNVSYIILSACMCCETGLYASMLQMIFHSLTKIIILFVVGYLMKRHHIYYLDEVSGLAKKMPICFLCFTIAGFSLVGIPFFAGFVVKYEIASTLIIKNTWYAIIGLIALFISSFLTTIYVFEILFNALFKKINKEKDNINEKSKRFLIPLCILTIVLVVMGLYYQPLLNFLKMGGV